MVINVVMPKLGLTMRQGTVVKWLKKEGERVVKGDELLEIETEKITTVIMAPASGTLFTILAHEGSVVPIAEPVAVIAEDGEETSAKSASLSQKAEAPLEVLEMERAELVEVTEVVPMVGIRKTIAERLSQSYRDAVHVAIMMEIDMTQTGRLRKEIIIEVENKARASLTYTDIMVKAVAMSLREHPIVNSTLDNSQIKLLGEINIGIAVALEEGLIVPVIRNSDKKSLQEISLCAKKLADKARKGLLSIEESTGGTFTITNLGMFGVHTFEPIINPPETAILGVGAISDKVVVSDGKFVAKPMLNLTLVFDHRILDGSQAARFLQTLKRILENPSVLMN